MPDTTQQLRGTQLALWLVSEHVPINFTLTARVRGTFYADQLQSALSKLQHKYPPLSMRVKSESKGKAFLIPDTSLKIPVRRVEQYQPDSWIKEVTAELVRGFDPQEPPLRIVWVKGDEFSELIFVCPHALADGLAAAYLIRDLLTYLNDLNAPAEPMPLYPLINELIPDFAGRQTVVWLSKLKGAIVKILLSLRSKEDKSHLTDPAAAKTDYHLLSWN
jgi:hypothetical protein